MLSRRLQWALQSSLWRVDAHAHATCNNNIGQQGALETLRRKKASRICGRGNVHRSANHLLPSLSVSNLSTRLSSGLMASCQSEPCAQHRHGCTQHSSTYNTIVQYSNHATPSACTTTAPQTWSCTWPSRPSSSRCALAARPPASAQLPPHVHQASRQQARGRGFLTFCFAWHPPRPLHLAPYLFACPQTPQVVSCRGPWLLQGGAWGPGALWSP